MPDSRGACIALYAYKNGYYEAIEARAGTGIEGETGVMFVNRFISGYKPDEKEAEALKGAGGPLWHPHTPH